MNQNFVEREMLLVKSNYSHSEEFLNNSLDDSATTIKNILL